MWLSDKTFEVLDHHYSLVEVSGLAPDSTTEYQVLVDGVVEWPLADSGFPPSVIRTRGPASAHRHRFVFGSCRYPKAEDPEVDEELGLDTLDRYAVRMRNLPVSDWPDTLILLGDQVYADDHDIRDDWNTSDVWRRRTSPDFVAVGGA